MVTVCLPHPLEQTRIDQWGYALTSFPVDAVALREQGPHKRPFHKALHLTSISQFGLPIVVMQPREGRYVQGDVSLHDFVHPESCVYVFGGDDVHMQESDLDGANVQAKVFIPCIEQLFSATAFSITMYDRAMKNG